MKSNHQSDPKRLNGCTSDKDQEQISLTLSISDNTEIKNPSIIENISFELGTESSKITKKIWKVGQKKVVEIPFDHDVNNDKTPVFDNYTSSAKKKSFADSHSTANFIAESSEQKDNENYQLKSVKIQK